MDKQTLSNYGWVVIAVLVLAVMLAIATPFGQFVATGVENTLFSLIGTSDNALGTITIGINNQTKTNYTKEQIEADDHLYGIGKTKSEYVVAKFNDDFTEVVITKNGEDSDGLMKDWDDTNPSPITQYSDKLKQVKFENGIKNVGAYAFYNLKITNMDISKIGFNVKLCNGIESIGDYAFAQSGTLRYLEIPNTVKSIGNCAFYKSNLSRISISEGLESIGNTAFAYSNLKEIIIPNSVTNAGSGAFFECDSLKNVILGTGLSKMPDTFFREAGLRNVFIPKNITETGTLSFYYLYSPGREIRNIYFEGSEEEWKNFAGSHINDFNIYEVHFNSSYSVNSSTCTENGSFTYECSCCGKQIKETTSYGHYVRTFIDKEIPATCTEPKHIEEYTYCYVCEQEVERRTYTQGYANGHKYETHVLSEPTCTENGEKENVCSVCGDAYKYTVNKTGHSIVDGVCTICGLDEKLQQVENFANELKPNVISNVETYNISYYSAMLLYMMENSNEALTYAEQGDDEIENYVNNTMKEFFISETGDGSIDTVDEYFEYLIGKSAKDIAYYIQNNSWPT